MTADSELGQFYKCNGEKHEAFNCDYCARDYRMPISGTLSFNH